MRLLSNAVAGIALLGIGCIALPSQAQPEATHVIEAEDFQFPGDWNVESDGQASGGRILKTTGGNTAAITAFTLALTGKYNVWVRARDFNEQPGTRRYKIAVDGELFQPEFGAHGTNGWKWEKAGERELSAGDHVLALQDVSHFFGRNDAVLLTTTNTDPNTLGKAAIQQLRLLPKKVEAHPVDTAAAFAPAPAFDAARSREVAKLENDSVRVRFLSSPVSASPGAATPDAATSGAGGTDQIVRETELKINGTWRKLPVNAGAEKLFLLYTPKTEIAVSTMIPTWTTQPPSSPLYRFTVGGKNYDVRLGSANPFYAAPAEAVIGRAVRQVNPREVEVQYRTAAGLQAVGRWQLGADTRALKFAVDFTAPNDGYYSFGFSPFQPWARRDVQFDLLPPLFQFNRLPESATMLADTVTPQPLALAQIGQGREATSYAVLADPDRLPFEWPNPTNASYGFSLLNATGEVQPTAFAPVLGLPKSQMKRGDRKSIGWIVLANAGDWKDTLEYASNSIFHVTDYRKPYRTSLTEAALNMVDLMKDADASGWNDRLKGFYNIETTDVTTHASPLTVLSAAILTHDEDFYVRRALPTIEYTLSRPSAHFGVEVPKTAAPYVNEEAIKMKVPSDFYGTVYWQGLHDLLGRHNPWIADFAMPDGQVRYRTSYSTLPRWSEMLGAYRLKPDAALLNDIKAETDKWLQTDVYARKTNYMGVQPFYNVSNYPYWWDLLDLYELTSDKQYLDAAQEGAFGTIAGLWSHPRVPEGNVTIHPGGEFPGLTHIWWKGSKEYRLGVPRHAGDAPEKQVPAWLVAQMGLGLEQPSTYYGGGSGGLQNIMMSAWAPNLLRLYRYTGRDIFRVYARNAIISRFETYPGYYLNGFTDLELDPQYPFKGPDVTSIYYHHIPPHLAFTIDFVVTEAGQRSNGAVSFPWVKQQGYVWFSNRIYGDAPGSVYGDKTARLWLDRKAVQVQSPAINYLMARGDNQVWLVLLSEADAATQAPIKLDKSALGLTGANYTTYTADGKTTPGTLGDILTVSIPAKGMVTLAFPAREQKAAAIPALQNGRATQKLAGEWGTLEAFRIRSPFGKDSLYVVLTGRPADGATAILQLEGAAPIEKKEYPFEFSVYPWAMDRDLKFTVQLKDAAGQTLASQPVTLAGTSGAVTPGAETMGGN